MSNYHPQRTMSWIKTIDYENASPPLRKIYDRIKGPENRIDNVLTIHSLRPHTLTGHMTLYKSVLHHTNNDLPKWYLEAVGVYVSYLNKCDYCFEHHYSGMKRLMHDDHQAEILRKAILTDKLAENLDRKYATGCRYAKQLTCHHDEITSQDITDLREAGFTDGQILELNQVISYFNYVNRTVVGLGVDLDGDVLGLSPNNSDNPSDWSHQ